jgi:hypothetical protein
MRESPIFTRTFDMLMWLLPATTKFPKEQRFILAQRTQKAAFEFYEAITAASLSRPDRFPQNSNQTQLVLFSKVRLTAATMKPVRSFTEKP